MTKTTPTIKPKNTYISSRDAFITPPREYFLRDNNPQLVQGDFLPNNDFNWFELTVNSYSTVDTIKTGVEWGNKILKLENRNKTISNLHLKYGAKKGFSFSFAPVFKKKVSYNQIQFAKKLEWVKYPIEKLRKAPLSIKSIKAAEKTLDKTAAIIAKTFRIGSKQVVKQFAKKVPFVGLGIAAYNIHQSKKWHENGFIFFADSVFEIADAFSPVPFTKEIFEGSGDFEAKKLRETPRLMETGKW